MTLEAALISALSSVALALIWTTKQWRESEKGRIKDLKEVIIPNSLALSALRQSFESLYRQIAP